MRFLLWVSRVGFVCSGLFAFGLSRWVFGFWRSPFGLSVLVTFDVPHKVFCSRRWSAACCLLLLGCRLALCCWLFACRLWLHSTRTHICTYHRNNTKHIESIFKTTHFVNTGEAPYTFLHVLAPKQEMESYRNKYSYNICQSHTRYTRDV